MGKRGAGNQITREGGGHDEEEGSEVEESKMATPEAMAGRKIRGLPSRKGTPSASPAPSPSAFTFGATVPPSNGTGSPASFSFGAASPNPFAAIAPTAAPVNPFAKFGATSTIPVVAAKSEPGATSAAPSATSAPPNPFASVPKPTPFSFGAASTTTPSKPVSGFTFGAGTSTPTASPATFIVPPAPKEPPIWGNSTSLPSTSASAPAAPATTTASNASSIASGPTLTSFKLPVTSTPGSPFGSTIADAPDTPKPAATPASPFTFGATNPSSASKPAGSSNSFSSGFSFKPVTQAPTPPAEESATPLPSSSPAPTPAAAEPTPAAPTSAPSPTISSTSAGNVPDQEKVKYYTSIRGLNHSLLNLLSSLVARDEFVDLTGVLSDLSSSYGDKRKEITGGPGAEAVKGDEDMNAPKTDKVVEKEKETPAVVIPPVFGSTGGFSFGGAPVASSSTAAFPTSSFSSSSPAAVTSTVGFSFAPPSSTTAAALTTAKKDKKVSFAASDQKGDKETVTSTPSSLFSFGETPTNVNGDAAPAKSSPFNFGSNNTASTSASSAPFSFGALPSKPAATPFSFGSPAEKKADDTAARSSQVLADVLKPASSQATSSDSSKAAFSFGMPSSSASTTSTVPSSLFGFGSTPSPASAPAAGSTSAPAFSRLPSGTANFSFGAAAPSPGGTSRSVSSAFNFGTTPAPAITPQKQASPPPGDGAEDAPPPSIPSDPTLMQSGEGEEDEDIVLALEKGKVFKFDEAEPGSGKKTWIVVGLGPVQVKKGGAPGNQGRILVRAGTGGKVLLNFKLHAALDVKANKTAVSMNGFEGSKPFPFQIKVKTAEMAENLRKALQEGVDRKE